MRSEVQYGCPTVDTSGKWAETFSKGSPPIPCHTLCVLFPFNVYFWVKKAAWNGGQSCTNVNCCASAILGLGIALSFALSVPSNFPYGRTKTERQRVSFAIWLRKPVQENRSETYPKVSVTFQPLQRVTFSWKFRIRSLRLFPLKSKLDTLLVVSNVKLMLARSSTLRNCLSMEATKRHVYR